MCVGRGRDMHAQLDALRDLNRHNLAHGLLVMEGQERSATKAVAAANDLGNEIVRLRKADASLTLARAHSVAASNLVARTEIAAQTQLGNEIAALQGADETLSLSGAHSVAASHIAARTAIAAQTQLGNEIAALQGADETLSLHGAHSHGGRGVSRKNSEFGGTRDEDTAVLARDGRFGGLKKLTNRSLVAMFLRLIAWLNDEMLNPRGSFHDYELKVELAPLDGSVKECFMTSESDERTQRKYRAGGRDKKWTYKTAFAEYEALVAAKVRVAVRLRPCYGRACGAHM
jgi:hypothetical protein